MAARWSKVGNRNPSSGGEIIWLIPRVREDLVPRGVGQFWLFFLDRADGTEKVGEDLIGCVGLQFVVSAAMGNVIDVMGQENR